MDLDLSSIPIPCFVLRLFHSIPLPSLKLRRWAVSLCRVLITLVMPGGVIEGPSLTRRSEVTPEGITETELGQTLLNGNNIAMVSRRCLLSRHRAPGKYLLRMRPPASV